MTPEIAACAMLYGLGVIAAFVTARTYDDGEALSDAVWWPIYAAKGVLKGLLRAVSRW